MKIFIANTLPKDDEEKLTIGSEIAFLIEKEVPVPIKKKTKKKISTSKATKKDKGLIFLQQNDWKMEKKEVQVRIGKIFDKTNNWLGIKVYKQHEKLIRNMAEQKKSGIIIQNHPHTPMFL